MLSLLLATALAAATPAPDALPTPERRQQLLFDAARLGRTDMITPLVKAGVDLNATDARGFTPLILAVVFMGSLMSIHTFSGGASMRTDDATPGLSAYFTSGCGRPNRQP